MHLRFYCININHNTNFTGTLLEKLQKDIDILFIQEPSYRLVRNIPSATNPDGDPLVGTPTHPAWTLIQSASTTNPDATLATPPRVSIYINNSIRSIEVRLREDIIKHRDILLISLTPAPDPERRRRTRPKSYFFMNVYNDSVGSALRKIHSHDNPPLPPITLMQGDFNIHSQLWDSGCTTINNDARLLMEIADSMNVTLLNNMYHHTHFPFGNPQRGSVIDLAFIDDDILANHDVQGGLYTEPHILKDSDWTIRTLCGLIFSPTGL